MQNDAAKEVVLFCSGLGGAAAYWSPQLDTFGKHFRVVTYDQRGTGPDRSRLPQGYSIADMADEAAAVLDRLGISSCHFIGHALGGAVGLEFARRHSTRLRRLGIVNGWARIDSHTERCFEARLALLKHCGVPAYIRATPIFLYPAAWASANAERLAAEDANAVAHFQGIDNLLARLAALRTWDATGYLDDVVADVLTLAAKDDALVPWTASEFLVAHLPHGRMTLLDDGGHACTVTRPEASNAALLEFLRA
ncbi:MAG TPA: pyrimidine utilization protein D [Candidatus Binataceae bacterium]|nr:pyrimidine utilization protein D [Candidatus Binataceae bacterium]